MSNTKSLSPEEQLAKLNEKRERVFKNVAKAKLANNEQFKNMADAYRKAKRFLNEAEGLVADETYNAQRARLEERLNALECKRAIALEAVDELSALIERHETAQKEIAAEVVALINGEKIPDNFDETVNALMSRIGATELSQEPVDPFVNYRRQTSEENAAAE
jgi:uncharacterized coiled-coil protein SlyX